MKKILKVALGVLFTWPVLMFIQANRNIVKKETVYLRNVPASFLGKNILFISDIHKRVLPQRFINSFQHDVSLVIIGGDLLEKGVTEKKVRKNVQRLKQAGAVLFVWGNNDLEEKHMLEAILHQESVTMLENKVYEWRIGEEAIYIAGIGDRNGMVNKYITSLLKEDETAFLVTHDPADLKKLASLTNVEFALAGHTHGGQIRLGGYGISEKGGWSEKYGIPLLISNGYGTSAIPFRWEAPPEVHLLALQKK